MSQEYPRPDPRVYTTRRGAEQMKKACEWFGKLLEAHGKTIVAARCYGVTIVIARERVGHLLEEYVEREQIATDQAGPQERTPAV